MIRQVERPTYDDLTRAQMGAALDGGGADLGELLYGPDTWTVRDGVVLDGATHPLERTTR